MDPITISLLAVLLLGAGGGFYWYEKYGPGASAASSSTAPVQITLDASLPSGDQQAIIAAIMTQTSPTALATLAAKYSAYPWAVYELNYRAWQLGGSQGAPPAQPATPGTPAAPATPATPSTPSTPAVPNLPLNVLPPQPGGPPAPSAPPPSSGPFDLSAAITSDAWQTNSAFITAYQGALTFLAYKYAQPTWAPAAVTGSYDASTQSAVKAYQTSNNLSPVDGKVGKDTATSMATMLVAPTTQTSGQGSYAAYPAGGTGPSDSRYGAQGKLSVRGLSARDQVHGLGEDTVQGLGEDTVQGLGEAVQGLGEDDVQGVKRAQATKGLGVDNVQGLGVDNVQGLGEGVQGLGVDNVQGLGVDNVQGLLKKSAAQAVGAAMAVPVAPAAPRTRPHGGWYIHMRETDSVWPRKVAEIGSGVPRGTPGSLQHLVDINPHLAAGGVLRQFGPGDEVNIPGSWASALRQRGFDVRPDASSTEGMV